MSELYLVRHEVGWHKREKALLYDATFQGNNNEIRKDFTTVAECANWCLGSNGGWIITDPDTGV